MDILLKNLIKKRKNKISFIHIYIFIRYLKEIKCNTIINYIKFYLKKIKLKMTFLSYITFQINIFNYLIKNFI